MQKIEQYNIVRIFPKYKRCVYFLLDKQTRDWCNVLLNTKITTVAIMEISSSIIKNLDNFTAGRFWILKPRNGISIEFRTLRIDLRQISVVIIVNNNETTILTNKRFCNEKILRV